MALGGMLSGLASGITAGVAAGDTIGDALITRRALDAKERQADAALKKSTAEGVWDRGMKVWEDANMPSAVKVATYNRTMRGAMMNLGFDFPELPADFEIGAKDVELMRGVNAIVRNPNMSYDERRDNIAVMTAHVRTLPKYAPWVKEVDDRLAASRQAEVDTVATTYGRILAEDPTLTPEEARLFHAQRAIAQAPDRPEDEPWVRLSREDRGRIVSEGMRKAQAERDAQFEARTKRVMKFGATDRGVTFDPVSGVASEVVKAAPSEKDVLPARAAAATFAQLLAQNPGMSEEAAAIQAWRQYGDLPDSMKSLVPPLQQAEIRNEKAKQDALQLGRVEIAQQTGAAAAVGRSMAERTLPLGAERASKLFHPATREQAPPEISATEAERRGFRAIPEDQVKTLNVLEANLLDADGVIERRDDLFPRPTGSKVRDAANIAAAKVAEMAGRATGDPDIQTLDSLRGMMMQIQRGFGGTSRQMDSVIELLRTERAFHVTPGGHDAAREQLRVLRDRLDKGFGSVGLEPMRRPSPTKKGDSAGGAATLTDDEIMRRLRGAAGR